MRQLTEEEASGRIYRAEHDTNAVVLFVQAKRDDPTKPQCILHTKDRNEAVDPNYTPLPSIKELMELVAARKYWSKIDLADGYHNITIERLRTTFHLPHTHGILPQSHHATRRPQRTCHHGKSHVRNLYEHGLQGPCHLHRRYYYLFRYIRLTYSYLTEGSTTTPR